MFWFSAFKISKLSDIYWRNFKKLVFSLQKSYLYFYFSISNMLLVQVKRFCNIPYSLHLLRGNSSPESWVWIFVHGSETNTNKTSNSLIKCYKLDLKNGGMFNPHNEHLWNHASPHNVGQWNLQIKFRFNVCCGMVGPKFVFILFTFWKESRYIQCLPVNLNNMLNDFWRFRINFAP